MLTLNLPAVAYIASEATTAVALHVVKTVVYQRYIHLALSAWRLALYVGMAMIAGTTTGKRGIQRMSPARFQRFVAVLLVGIAVQMIVMS